jgi:hypothetical protein
MTRRERDQVMRDLGLVKVRGALGGKKVYRPGVCEATRIKLLDELNDLPLPKPSDWLITVLSEKPYMNVKGPLPPWFGNERLHSSHRAALLYKNPEWYGRFGWKEKPAVPDAKGRLPYYWPI